MAATRPQYVPSSEEMKDAVAVALKDVKSDKKPTTKELQSILESENPTWKIPERRVRKFLKRELKKQGMAPPEASPQDDDDEESVVSTTSRARELARSTVGSLKKVVTTPGKTLFSFRKKKQQKQAATNSMPPMVISTTKEYTTPEKKQAPVVEEPVVEEEVSEDKGIGRNKYEDDNDGNKEAQLCADICIIL